MPLCPPETHTWINTRTELKVSRIRLKATDCNSQNSFLQNNSDWNPKRFFLSVIKSFDFQIAAHPVWLAGSTTTLFLSNVGMMKQNKIGMYVLRYICNCVVTYINYVTYLYMLICYNESYVLKIEMIYLLSYKML